MPVLRTVFRVVLSALGVAAIVSFSRGFSESEGTATALALLGATILGGAVFAILLHYVPSLLGAPDNTSLGLHRGFYRWGPVGGLGGVLGLVGFIATGLFRGAPIVGPFLLVSLVGGVIVALAIARTHRRPRRTVGFLLDRPY